MTRLCALVCLAAVFTACASGSWQRLPLPDQDTTLSDPTKARVYIGRANQTFGKAWMVRIIDNGAEIGEVAQGEYLCYERAPGLARFEVILDRAVIAGGIKETVTSLTCEAGKTYYCGLYFDDRPGKEIEMRVLSEAQGAAAVRELTPATVVQ
ncbi:MAG: DUF2846 domain-containing protein [Planctomycetes bacterium]|nr:DUF2846 domain-containing protein [Planctomycetota bacterium]